MFLADFTQKNYADVHDNFMQMSAQCERAFKTIKQFEFYMMGNLITL